jgi:hypothetical protein
MKRFAVVIVIAIAGCGPHYESGKTQCSDKNECPSGYYCSASAASTTGICFSKNIDSGVGGAVGAFQLDGGVGKGGTGGVKTTITGSGGSSIIRTGSTGGTVGTGGIAGTVVNGSGGVGVGGAVGIGNTGRGGSGGFAGSGVVGSTLTGGAVGKGGAGGAGGSTSTSRCSGTPHACSGNTAASDCANESGCVWSSTTSACSATPLACNTYASATYCIYNGCSWSGTLTCTVSTVTAFCTGKLGGSACNDCMAQSCCAQYTNCYNDTNCYSDLTGSYWEPFLACAESCCATVCGVY